MSKGIEWVVQWRKGPGERWHSDAIDVHPTREEAEKAKTMWEEYAKNILGHRIVSGSTAHYVDGSVNIVPTIWA